MVGHDDPIAPPTLNEDWPDSCEVKRYEGMEKKNSGIDIRS